MYVAGFLSGNHSLDVHQMATLWTRVVALFETLLFLETL
jgi:hypothetical protein